MIVVVGSRHDRVATGLVASWQGAHLLSAEDLTSAGWAWSSDGADRRWVIAGQKIDDAQVTGVFLRRSTVYPEELLGIHPADRAYVAAEAHAHLIAVLASTRARVVNPVFEAGLGDEALCLERLLLLAEEAGVPVRPYRLTSSARDEPSRARCIVEVVDGEAFGEAPTRCRDRAVSAVRALELCWATCVFDGRQRLLTATTSSVPSREAIHALGRVLSGGEPCS